jgi:hypothetical protein
MDKAFIEIVQKLVSEQGKEILLNATKCKGLLADYTRGEYKKESRLLFQVLETGCQNEIASTSDIEITKQQIVKKLQDEEFIAEQVAVDIVDLLCLVLRGEEPEPIADPVSEAMAESQPEATTTGITDDLHSANAKIAGLESDLATASKTKNFLKGWLIAFILISVIAVSVGVSQYNGIVDDYNALNTWYNQLQGLHNTLQEKYNALDRENKLLYKNLPIQISSITVGNWNNGRWLNQPGNTMNSSQMRYLMPRIRYTSLISESISFDIKIIRPNGSLMGTYSSTNWINRGENQTLDLSGWGNANESIYSSGTWTVEVWYKGVCLKSQTVRLN